MSQLASLPTIAREIGVPYQSLRDCAKRGEFPIVKIGRAWKVDRADIDHWIAANKQRPVQPGKEPK